MNNVADLAKIDRRKGLRFSNPPSVFTAVCSWFCGAQQEGVNFNMEISRRSYLQACIAAVPSIQLARAAGTSLSAETNAGKVRGYTFNGVAIFRGIPYAGPTEGSARFLPPAKAANWIGERDCTAN